MTDAEMKKHVTKCIEKVQPLPRSFLDQLTPDQIDVAVRMYEDAAKARSEHADELRRYIVDRKK